MSHAQHEEKAASQPAKEVIIIKKYANRRLYNTETSTYVTLDDLYEMVKDGYDFEVRDAKSNDDLTRSVLTQIIFERESKNLHTLLPLDFLKQLILFYDDNIQPFVPHYLDGTMKNFMRNQEQFREYFAKGGFAAGIPTPLGEFNPLQKVEELTKKNMEVYQQAMNMFFGLSGGDKKQK